MSRSSYTANLSLQPIEPASWTKPAPVRCKVAEPTLTERLLATLPGVFGAFILAGSIFLPVFLSGCGGGDEQPACEHPFTGPTQDGQPLCLDGQKGGQ